jgi:hypothetical protein
LLCFIILTDYLVHQPASIANALFPMAVAMFLAACGSGGNGAPAIAEVAPMVPVAVQPSPVPATPTRATPAPSPGAVSGSQGNAAPTISGEPATAVVVGETYSFQPAAADANGDRLSFEVTNLPRWASFNPATGNLLGTPASADVGSYSDIGIVVTDGASRHSLKAFTIAVNQIAQGSATLSWLPPTENSDGSQLADLFGYQIHYGRDAANLVQKITVNNASLSRYLVANLSPGKWYFGVMTLNSKGVQSALSALASKTIL